MINEDFAYKKTLTKADKSNWFKRYWKTSI